MAGFKAVGSSRHVRPKPFLFPTPDGVLRSATSSHKRVHATTLPLAAQTIMLTSDGAQEYHREKHSPSMVIPTTTTEDDNKEKENESVDSCTRAAVERGLVAVLISVCSCTTVDGEQEASDVFSLQERV
ncbi:hypothetical protein LSM04_000075 [Trypanosoma melophagium]|uniref:uncharacterized protein n=1 Tax=Trypanosoma melophagium TaxID=715481 RepID=UPI00351A9CAF|nr:hypothetical protein LSM04_000075 [Trypanosoma melophagium]